MNPIAFLFVFLCSTISACDPWCNSFTCELNSCTDCSTCRDLELGRICAAWCNDWTTDFRRCQGCNSCNDGASFKDGNGVCVDVYPRDNYQCWSRDDEAVDLAGGVDNLMENRQRAYSAYFGSADEIVRSNRELFESQWNRCEEAYGSYPNISLTFDEYGFFYCDPSCDFVSKFVGRWHDDYVKITRGGAPIGPDVCEAPQRVHDQTFCKAREARTGILCLDREDAGFDFVNDDCIEHEEYELYDCEAVNLDAVTQSWRTDRYWIGREPPPRHNLWDLVRTTCQDNFCPTPEEVGINVTAGSLENVRLYQGVQTCFWAFNGRCDDGGPGSEYDACDFGTDCNDCGPRSNQDQGCTVLNVVLLHEECVDGNIHTSVYSQTPDGCTGEPLVTFSETPTHDMAYELGCPNFGRRELSKGEKSKKSFMGLHLHDTPKRKRTMQKLFGHPNKTTTRRVRA